MSRRVRLILAHQLVTLLIVLTAILAFETHGRLQWLAHYGLFVFPCILGLLTWRVVRHGQH